MFKKKLIAKNITKYLLQNDERRNYLFDNDILTLLK